MVSLVTSNRIRASLSVVVGLAVLIFGTDGSEGEGPTTALVVLAIAAALLTWHATRQQNSGAGK